MMVSRADRRPFAEWWWTVDRYLLFSLIALMVAGVVLSMAGSPAVAERLGLDSFHFVTRHAIFLVPSAVVMIAASFLTTRQVRRVSLALFVVMVLMMLATLVIGEEVKGSRRWIAIAGLTIQPSEFLKPGFIVLAAWLFAENSKRPDIPGNIISMVLLAMVAALLVAQPDFGQTLLVAATWVTLFFLAGMPWLWILGAAAVTVGCVVAAYTMLPHVAARIDRFLDPATGDTYQIDAALASFFRGGWFGQGPGEGVVKRILPDSHTDFIFAVTAEEFGILTCIVLLAIFAGIVLRGLLLGGKAQDDFTRLASAGLVVLFGLQSVINMAVNLSLMPAKGMTLPFISYGGSSMIATAMQMGLVLALTRRRPETPRVPAPGFTARAVRTG